MGFFDADDGTRLAYREFGDGPPLVCLPGGPMRDAGYLGDLGGLAEHRTLVILDLRGTGASAVPADPESYRCDRQIADVEALRRHLALDRFDLLAHSAGANLAVGYAAAYADRLRRLVLATPSTRGVDLPVTVEARVAMAELRRGEPWFEPAFAAMNRIAAGAERGSDWGAIDPFSYGRWDARAQAHAAAQRINEEAARAYGAFDPPATRAGIAALAAPVLILRGEYDASPTPELAHDLAALFRTASVVTQPGAGHYPWLDDESAFVTCVEGFLSG